MRKSRVLVAVIAVAASLPLAIPASAGPGDPWIFDGGGWGHGVGLSQFGAKGQADGGAVAEDIIQYYYADTSVGAPLPGNHWTTEPEGLKIGLVANTGSVDIEAVGGSITICQTEVEGAGVVCPPVPPYFPDGFADVTIDPDDDWVFETKDDDPTQCRFRNGLIGNLQWHECEAQLTKVADTGVRFKVNGIEYAHGSINMTPASNGFHVTVNVGLEYYLHGLDEVPSSWPKEALKTQAIIGRSYAVATATSSSRGGSDGSGILESCGCHLRSTTLDQAYDGWVKEALPGGDDWVEAVTETEGLVVTHPAANAPFNIATTFYSSSNGGWSENNEDVWGGSPQPWLRSTEDPWSADLMINPLAEWVVLVADEDMESALGWDRVFEAELLTGPPGVLFEFKGLDSGVDVSTQLNGTEVRALLNIHGYREDGKAVRVSPYIASILDPIPFDDIGGTLFENAISWLADEEITVGCNPPLNSLYCPDADVTRGQMAVFISRALDLPDASDDYFTDDNGAFYEGAANRIFEAGITSGCGGTNYCGQALVTRGQMAKLLANAMGLAPSQTDYFTDDDTSIFEPAIDKIAEAGITLGCNPPANTKYCPDLNVTRGQMAAFFLRAWGD